MSVEELTCERCGDKWERKSFRGRKSKLCENCRAPTNKPVGLPAGRKRRANVAPVTPALAGRALADHLDATLRAQGGHVSQPDRYADRNYSLVSILDRLETLEREVEKLKEG